MRKYIATSVDRDHLKDEAKELVRCLLSALTNPFLISTGESLLQKFAYNSRLANVFWKTPNSLRALLTRLSIDNPSLQLMCLHLLSFFLESPDFDPSIFVEIEPVLKGLMVNTTDPVAKTATCLIKAHASKYKAQSQRDILPNIESRRHGSLSRSVDLMLINSIEHTETDNLVFDPELAIELAQAVINSTDDNNASLIKPLQLLIILIFSKPLWNKPSILEFLASDGRLWDKLIALSNSPDPLIKKYALANLIAPFCNFEAGQNNTAINSSIEKIVALNGIHSILSYCCTDSDSDWAMIRVVGLLEYLATTRTPAALAAIVNQHPNFYLSLLQHLSGSKTFSTQSANSAGSLVKLFESDLFPFIADSKTQETMLSNMPALLIHANPDNAIAIARVSIAILKQCQPETSQKYLTEIASASIQLLSTTDSIRSTADRTVISICLTYFMDVYTTVLTPEQLDAFIIVSMKNNYVSDVLFKIIFSYFPIITENSNLVRYFSELLKLRNEFVNDRLILCLYQASNTRAYAIQLANPDLVKDLFQARCCCHINNEYMLLTVIKRIAKTGQLAQPLREIIEIEALRSYTFAYSRNNSRLVAKKIIEKYLDTCKN